MLKLDTKIPDLNLKELRDICKFGITFCSDKLGVNNRYKTPLKFSILRKKSEKKSMGEFSFENNKIVIFRNNIDTIEEFIKVFIHEYTHYLQPIKTKYHKLLDKFGYDGHPYEIEAEKNEKMYFNEFFNEYLKK
jgi:hypothetical protein